MFQYSSIYPIHPSKRQDCSKEQQWTTFDRDFPVNLKTVGCRTIQKLSGRMIYKLSGPSRGCPDNPETFRRESKSVAIYTLYPESFCVKNLAIRKVFAFSDSGSTHETINQNSCINHNVVFVQSLYNTGLTLYPGSIS